MAVYIFKRHQLFVGILVLSVSDGTVGHHFTKVIAPLGVGHTQWLKQLFIGKDSQRFTRNPFHNSYKQRIVGIAVIVFCAGRKIGAFLFAHNLQSQVLCKPVWCVATRLMIPHCPSPLTRSCG